MGQSVPRADELVGQDRNQSSSGRFGEASKIVGMIQRVLRKMAARFYPRDHQALGTMKEKVPSLIYHSAISIIAFN